MALYSCYHTDILIDEVNQIFVLHWTNRNWSNQVQLWLVVKDMQIWKII